MKKFLAAAITVLIIGMLAVGAFFIYAIYNNKKPVGQIFTADTGDIRAEDIPAIQASAEKDDMVAEYKLALAYSLGQGVNQDYAEAANWAQKSAEQGYAKAQTFLGVMYMKGEGVPVDDETAYMWFLIAAAQEDPNAQITLKVYNKILPKEEIESANKRATEWKQEHG